MKWISLLLALFVCSPVFAEDKLGNTYGGVPPANAAGQILGTDGTVPEWETLGGGNGGCTFTRNGSGSYSLNCPYFMPLVQGSPPQFVGYGAVGIPEAETATGDLTFARTASNTYKATVVGIQGIPVPTLAAGYLHFNGTAFIWDTPTGGGGGGIPEAPTDGHNYARKNSSWNNIDSLFAPLNNPTFTGWIHTPQIDLSSATNPLTFNGVALGGTCSAGQFVNALSGTGVLTCATPAGGTGGVASFNSRTGTVTLLLSDVTGVGGAPIAGPTFTGTVTLPGNAASALQAVPLQQVQSLIAAAPNFTAGGDLSGTSTTQKVIGIQGVAVPVPTNGYLWSNGTTLSWQPSSGMPFAPLTNPAGGQNNYAPLANPTFTGTVTLPAGTTVSGYLPLTGGTLTGGLTFNNPSATNRIMGDMGNAPRANRLLIQGNTATSTNLMILPPTGQTTAFFSLWANTDVDGNSSYLQAGMSAANADAEIKSSTIGTGTQYPINFILGSTTVFSVGTTGVNLLSGTYQVGGVNFGGTCTGGQYVSAISSSVVPTCSTPTGGSFLPINNPTATGLLTAPTELLTNTASSTLLFGASTTTPIGSIMGYGPTSVLEITSGGYYDGTNWKATQTSFENLAIGGGHLYFQVNTGLTVGSNVSPQIIGDMSPGIGFNYAGATNGADAPVGNVGEFQSATSTTLPNSLSTPGNLVSVSLGAGDWQIWGQMTYTANGTGVQLNGLRIAISTVSATFPTGAAANAPGDYNLNGGMQLSGGSYITTFPTGVARVNSASSFTAYLVAGASISGTLSGPTNANVIYARRMR